MAARARPSRVARSFRRLPTTRRSRRLRAGVRQATHLFNCMPPLQHRARARRRGAAEPREVAAEADLRRVSCILTVVRTTVAAKAAVARAHDHRWCGRCQACPPGRVRASADRRSPSARDGPRSSLMARSMAASPRWTGPSAPSLSRWGSRRRRCDDVRGDAGGRFELVGHGRSGPGCRWPISSSWTRAVGGRASLRRWSARMRAVSVRAVGSAFSRGARKRSSCRLSRSWLPTSQSTTAARGLLQSLAKGSAKHRSPEPCTTMSRSEDAGAMPRRMTSALARPSAYGASISSGRPFNPEGRGVCHRVRNAGVASGNGLWASVPSTSRSSCAAAQYTPAFPSRTMLRPGRYTSSSGVWYAGGRP